MLYQCTQQFHLGKKSHRIIGIKFDDHQGRKAFLPGGKRGGMISNTSGFIEFLRVYTFNRRVRTSEGSLLNKTQFVKDH